jgi:hypothetical protein
VLDIADNPPTQQQLGVRLDNPPTQQHLKACEHEEGEAPGLTWTSSSASAAGSRPSVAAAKCPSGRAAVT